MSPHPALAAWHDIVNRRDPAGLDALLADEVVFHSPVVHTPQRGKAITTLYLKAALTVLGGSAFRYVREIVGEHDALLEFVTEIDGVLVNGIDLMRWDAHGRIVDFKVMVRPLKAVNALHQKMAEMLQRQAAAPPAATARPERGEPAMDEQTFDDFKAAALARGFDEVLVREWAPGQLLATHTHPFAVEARVVRGSFVLTVGDRERALAAGDGFEVPREMPHAERYGPEGATFWVARRHAAS